MARSKRSKGTRRPNGASSIYLGKDGKWHGRVTVGVRDDGKPDRRHIERKTEAEVIDAVRALEKQRDAGKVKKPGRAWTVEKWLTHWFENIAAPCVRYKAANAYRTAVYRHLVPNLGAHRIDKIEPEHFEKLYAKMRAAGLKAGTAHQVHRTARTAFGEALRRGHIVRNPVELAKAPRIEETEIEPFEADEIGQLLMTALSKRNGVRFVLALALGTRQGETIGLKWSRLDKRNKTLRITKQLQRQTWKHGCDDPHACGSRYHKVTPCKEGATPPEALPTTLPARLHGACALVPEAPRGRPGRSGREVASWPASHRAARPSVRPADRARGTPGQGARACRVRVHEGGWMFAQPNGKPLDPRRDLDDWKALLDEAGVREARLHDARHTAATVLLVLGVPERAVMEFMGWSNSSMAKRYQHITGSLRRDIADRLNGYLWDPRR